MPTHDAAPRRKGTPQAGAAFKELLTALGLTQARLSQFLGVHAGTVTKWVDGTNPVPSWAVAFLMAYEGLPLERRAVLLATCKEFMGATAPAAAA